MFKKGAKIMSICKRGDTYSYRVYVYDHERGKNRQIEKRGFKTKKAAKIAEAQFLADYELKSSIKRHTISFESVYDYYITQKGKQWKETTKYGLMTILNKRVLEYFKNLDMTKIVKRHINAWRETMNNLGFTARYKNKLLTHLRGIFSFGQSEFGLVKNPLANEPPFKENSLILPGTKDKKLIYDEVEFLRYQTAIDDIMYKLFFTMLFYTGLRIGELRAIKWMDIDRENGILTVNKQISNKTSSRRAVEVLPKTQSSIREVFYPISNVEHLIQEYILIHHGKISPRNDFYVFGGSTPIPETNIRRANIKHALNADLHVIKIHGFRHSYITMLYNKNVDPLTTKDQVGHSSIKTTLDIYTKLDNTQRKSNIDKAFNKKSE